MNECILVVVPVYLEEDKVARLFKKIVATVDVIGVTGLLRRVLYRDIEDGR